MGAVSPRLIPSPTGYPTIIFIAGIQATPLVRIKNLSITDVLNEQPNTASLTVNVVPHLLPSPPFHPPSFDNVAFNTAPSPSVYPNIRRGQPIEIYSGGASPEQLVFGGEIVTVQQIYEADVPANVAYHLSCIDHTRALNRRKVTKSYPTQSVTAIVLDLMASRLADGFTTQFVQAALPPIAIDFTFEDMNRALTRLANRIGAYWYVDYTKALHFFIDEPGNEPAPLEPGGERFDDLTFDDDLTQVRTRVLVEGAGSIVSTQIQIGETMVPVRDPVMFQPSGGLAIIGQQRISYTGVQVGDQGALVGPGAQPGAAPVATAIVGAGIEAGAHNYAVTYQSASGESLPSPIASVTLGKTDPPTAAPTPNPPTAGTGPDPGVHQYAVSFVTANGETTPGPTNSVTTTQAGGVPTPGITAAVLRHVVGNLIVGVTYRYETTITTAGGETLPGAASLSPYTAPRAPDFPTSVWTGNVFDVSGGSMAPGSYQYSMSFVVGGYETLMNTRGSTIYTGAGAILFQTLESSSDPRVTHKRLYRSYVGVPNANAYLVAELPNATVSYTDTKSDAQLGPQRPPPTNVAIGTPPGDQATITIPTSGDARAVGRKIYRAEWTPQTGAWTPFRFLATINNNTATQYIDNIASVSANPDAPTTDTTGGAQTCVVSVTNIPIGPGAVTARKLYRTPANSTQLLLLATISNNTATSYSDNKGDSALTVIPPSTNTTDTRQVALSKIPIGSTGVTARKVYRTAANAAQLRLLATIADNVTTTYTDAAADAALGANVPTVDTSNLQQPTGQVNAGATIMPVSATAGFAATGGFAVVGNGEQVIRYTGITATTLTGIPPTGPGSLTSTVPYNSSVTNAPALIGVPASGPGAIAARALVDGEEIHLLIQRDDLQAQANLAAIEGGDGVIEHYIQDRRLSASGATATADAELKLFRTPEIRVRYTTRDPKTKSGKTIAANLPSPTNLVGEFLIQRVQITQFDLPGIPPLRTVEASSTRFSFEDLLRRLEFEVTA